MSVKALCAECAAEYKEKGFDLRAMVKKELKKEPCECCGRRSGDVLLYEMKRRERE